MTAFALITSGLGCFIGSAIGSALLNLDSFGECLGEGMKFGDCVEDSTVKGVNTCSNFSFFFFFKKIFLYLFFFKLMTLFLFSFFFFSDRDDVWLFNCGRIRECVSCSEWYCTGH